jgi:small subunit ribosomal protein S21
MSVNFTINLRDDNVEKAIKKMKTKMSKLGITKDLREKMYYEKPSDKKVRVRKANIINSKKNKRMREKRSVNNLVMGGNSMCLIAYFHKLSLQTTVRNMWYLN